MLKRTIDIAASATLLVATSPILLVAAALVRTSSPGPILFRQRRVGRHGRVFEILKFRTMRVTSGPASAITIGRDPRITRVGHWLRQTKLDELPQLINVLRGEMSLIGPRPEVPDYVAQYPPALRQKVLSVRPGISDRSSIKYRNEAELLARQPDPDHYYRTVVLPDKLRLAADYADNASVAEDVRIMLATLRALFRRDPDA